MQDKGSRAGPGGYEEGTSLEWDDPVVILLVLVLVPTGGNSICALS